MAKVSSELSYAIRPKVVLKHLGRLLIALAVFILPLLAVSLYFEEYVIAWDSAVLVCSFVIIGMLLRKMQADEKMQLNESMILAAVIFLITAISLTYPLMTSGLNFADSLFESISSITTTGLTMISNIEKASPSVLFARAWMQWFGALAIVVFSLALLTQPGIVATIAELQEDDLTGGVREHFKRSFQIYLLLTIIGVLIAFAFNSRFFDSVLLIFSAISTGGMSPYNAGIGSLTLQTQWWITVISFVGAMPLIYFYRKLFGIRTIAIDKVQIWGLSIIACITILMLALCFYFLDGFNFLQVAHHAPLLALSALTTSGFSTLSVSELDAGSKLLLVFLMLIGGSVGSTSGGFKILRFLIAVNIFRFILLKTCLSKHAVAEPYLARRRLEYSEIAEGLLLIIIYFSVIALSWLVFVIEGYDPLNALFEVTSAIGTVGLSVGITNTELPTLLKGVLCIDMLMGRLEIFAWLIMLYPKTWFGKRMEAV